MTRYSRYLYTKLSITILGVLLFVLCFHLLIRIADGGDYDWLSIKVYFLEIPNTILLFFPFAILIGGLLSLGGMNTRNEITAMRASGASRLFISFPLFVISLIFSVIILLVMEFLTPKIYDIAEIDTQTRTQQSWQKLDEGYAKIITPKDQQNLDSAAVPEYRMNTFFGLPGEPIQQIIFNGRIADASNALKFNQKQDISINESRDQITSNNPNNTIELSRAITQAQRRSPLQANYGLQPTVSWKTVSALRQSGQPYQSEANELWRLLLLPLTYLSVAMVVLPFAFSTARNAKVGKRLFIGILIGLAFYVVSRLVGSLALVYPIHPAIAISAAPMLLILISLWWINSRI